MNRERKPPRIRSMKFNVLMNMILTSSAFLFPMITVPYVSRVLGAEGTGLVSFAQSVSTYFSLVALLGMSHYGVRACAQVRDDEKELSKTVKELLCILLVSTTLVFVVFVACLAFIDKFNSHALLFIEFGLVIWLSSFGVEWFYQALEQYEYITIRNIAFKLIGLVLMFMLVKHVDDYLLYGFIVVISGYGSNLLNIIRLSHLVDFKIDCKLDPLRHLKPMVYFAMAAISSGMYTQADIVLLGFLGTPRMLGIYQLVAKIKQVMITAVNSVGNVMLPRLSYYRSSDRQQKAEELIAKNLDFVFIVGMAAIALIVVCADVIVYIMGGEEFADSAIPLILISPAVLLSSANVVLGNHMISNGDEKLWAKINISGLIVAITLNLVLVPLLGVRGSALSISLCEAFIFCVRLYECRRLMRSIAGMLDPIKIVACASVAGACSKFCFEMSGSMLMGSLFAVATFSLLYLVLLLVSKEWFVQSLFDGHCRKRKNLKI